MQRSIPNSCPFCDSNQIEICGFIIFCASCGERISEIDALIQNEKTKEMPLLSK